MKHLASAVITLTVLAALAADNVIALAKDARRASATFKGNPTTDNPLNRIAGKSVDSRPMFDLDKKWKCATNQFDIDK